MITAPKYQAGSVIDLRFSKDHMPDRIYINMVYAKARSNEWMYEVISEMSEKLLYIKESDIDKRISHKSANCYTSPIVVDMYKSGYRFCGNSKSETAFSRAEKYKSAKYIRHIVLRSAIDEDGNIVDGQLGLWVQYNNVIQIPDGDNNEDYYVVK